MSSIDQNQEENNYKYLESQEAGERIKEMGEHTRSCFFCTGISTGKYYGVRPMSVQQADKDGTLWFLSSKNSHKNQEIRMNDEVRLYFRRSAHTDFLFLNGIVSISDDPKKIKELWTPLAKTWFAEGEKNPRISIIKVVPKTGFYWDNKHGNMIAGTKILVGSLFREDNG